TLTFTASIFVFLFFDKKTHLFQFVESYDWLPQWSIKLTIGVDGISAPFMLLITIVTLASILLSWHQINRAANAYYINILVLEGIMIGLFASTNLIQFFIFWEAMLIPLFLLIGLWGGDKKRHAAFKFLLFTFGGSIFMFVAIMALYFMGYSSMDITRLSTSNIPHNLQPLFFWAFVIAFAVKIPLFPLHTWLPDTYYESPTPVTLILSAVLAKMGAYGLIRIALPMLPEASVQYSRLLIAMSLATIIYGAYVALSQRDFKRLIAYSSMSHMGFIALGIFTLNTAGIEGGIIQMINHAIVTGGLFICAGILNQRTGSYNTDGYGNLALRVPWFVTMFTILVLAGSGFPGLNYFVGEFLILSSAFDVSVYIGLIAIVGVLLNVTYKSWFYYKLILKKHDVVFTEIKDLSLREIFMLAPFIISIFYLGVQPQALLTYLHFSVAQIMQRLSGHSQTLTMFMEYIR
ncbi:MAG TPA: NADH-quinone oxidoreductase subunit M, partial [Nitrospirae bacterium]|nr:NADH-quinone oxidoreductase subunit M [Nitrospirota bacterium]